VRYRDHGRGQRKRSFERKLDAERFARAVEADLLRGDRIDPRRSKEPFEEWAVKWMATLGTRKPTVTGCSPLNSLAWLSVVVVAVQWPS
jgi:hypothetical protein